jgi:hypothetical protein
VALAFGTAVTIMSSLAKRGISSCALLAIFLYGVLSSAETCEIRKPSPIVVRGVCGRVNYEGGTPIENAELRLIKKYDELVAKTQTNASGEFAFDAIEKGDYRLVVVKSAGWAGVQSPITVKAAQAKPECERPIYVALAASPQLVCHSWMTSKKPKFKNAQTH